MFEQLFERPHTVARYRAGPLLEERLRYLTHLDEQGVSRSLLRHTAHYTLVVATALRLADRPGEVISRREVAQQAMHWSSQPGPGKVAGALRSRVLFASFARRWLQFLGRLQPRPCAPQPDAATLAVFADHLARDKGLAPLSVALCCTSARTFLGWLRSTGVALQEVTAAHLDQGFVALFTDKGCSPVTVQRYASNLRHFFRFAQQCGWCRPGLAAVIQAPRVFSQATLPVGPTWDEVRQVLAMTEDTRPMDIRDRALLMLLAVYGLRCGEVIGLRLDDIDWEQELLRVARPKTGQSQTYPLSRSVAAALVRYLKEVRPQTARREIFLTRCAPPRPLCHSTVYLIVSRRLRIVSPTLARHGAHAFRHACATHLLEEGLSLKEIGDYLGHRHPDTTRIYAKVDLPGLRKVADFDLGGLL